MSGGFTVSTSELRSHSKTVGVIAEDVGTAASAAGTTRAGGLVYGVLFDEYALPFLNLWADSIHHSVSAAQKAGESISQSLSTNAETYDAAEDGNKTQITKSGAN